MSTFFPTPDDDQEEQRRLWAEHLKQLPQTQPAVPVSPVPVPNEQSQAAAPQAPAANTEPQADLNSVLKALTAKVMNDKPNADDQALQKLWADQERKSLQRAGGSSSGENWAVGLGAAIPMLAGIIADSATPNAYGVRGTGLGKIAQAGVDNAQALMQQQDARQKQAQSLAEAAAGIRKQGQNQDFDKLAKLGNLLSERDRIGIAYGQLGARGDDTRLKVEAQAYRLDPNHPQAVAIREAAYAAGVPRGSLDGLGTEALKQNKTITDLAINDKHFAKELEQKTQLASATGYASTAASNAADHANAPTKAADESLIAQARSRASEQGQRLGQSENRPTPYGYTVVDQALFDNTNSDSAQRARMERLTAAGDQIDRAANSIKSLRKRYGTSTLPSATNSEYELNKSVILGGLNALSEQGVMNPSERLNWDVIFPGMNLGSGTMTEVLSKLSGQDLKYDQLEGIANGVRRITNDSARQFGLNYTPDAPRATTPASQPSAAPKASSLTDLPGYKGSRKPSLSDFE